MEKLYKILEVTTKQLFDFNYTDKSAKDIKQEVQNLIKANPEKLNDVYKILKGFLD